MGLINRNDYPEVLEPKEIQEILKLGRRQTYELLADAPFRVLKVGRNYKIPKHVFFNWFEGNEKKD
ncbi:DNA-binding protein [Peribacillus sp. NPDC056705]|uniref:DNA-binding protein n=1 Tax=Peribacillus sp. NPDC056705 TaxID=3345918 RepID=UPI003749054E